MPTRIQWADEVWNVTSGCRRVSEGCRNCYAERMARRLKGMGLPQYQNVVDEHGWTGKVAYNEDVLAKPRDWVRPRRIFVDSMADLFHIDSNGFNTIFMTALFSIMLTTPRHTYLLLTKRPGYARYAMHAIQISLSEHMQAPFPWPLPNVWMGVSAENQKTADERIPLLLQIPAVKHFVSLEPLLGFINLNYWMNNLDALDWEKSAIDWVITGCESGPGRRKADLDWFRSLRDECAQADVPFFLKQIEVFGKIIREPYLDGRQYLQFPGDKT